MRLLGASLFAGIVLIACSASRSNPATGGPADDAAVADDAGEDAGWDAAAACDSPDATTALPCGTLAFAKSPVASRPRNHHVTLLAPTGAGTTLYAIGGANGEAPIAYVDRVPIAADGSLGAWTTGPALPVASGGLVGDVVNGVIVVAGGTTASGVTDKAYSSVIQPDGSLGAWQAAGSILKDRMHAGSFTIGNTMWIMGGFEDPNVWSDIVSATVQPDGTVSAWASAGQLPGPRSHFSVTVVGSYVYIAGGLAQSAFDNPPDLQDAWRGQVQADGTVGDWVQMTNLAVAEATHASFFYGGYLHVCGGINDVPAQEDRCWRSPIEADDSLGAFEEIAPLLIARGHVHQMPVLGRKVYSVAGAIDFNLDSTTEIDVGTFGPGTGMMVTREPRPAPVAPSGPKPMKGAKCHLGSHAKPVSRP
ncbi:MAG: hypothetical protein ABSE49_24010 [Polyangiaceae bacterium]